MKKAVVLSILVVAVLLAVGVIAQAQQADAPVYRDCDWWRIKIDTVRPTGTSISGPQFGGFSEYIVRFESANPKVFGIRGELSKKLDAPPIVSVVLGRTGWRGELVKFPVRVGLTWSDQYQFQPHRLPMR